MEVRPFEIAVDQSVLDDLQVRLTHTRWPDEIPGAEWDYGSNLDYIKELVDYWRTEFDWRAQEKKLNAFHHFKSEVEGLDIHFIHERGRGPNPIALVITHGWPSTFFEMTKIIPLLADPGSHGADPADSFDVVAPSLPGFGFSQATSERGMQVQKVADLWARLMTENLGYPKFAAQGGDNRRRSHITLGLRPPRQAVRHPPDLRYPAHALPRAGRPLADRGRDRPHGPAGPMVPRRRRLQPHSGAPSRRPFHTASMTLRRGWRRGSSRSTGLGATVMATWRAATPRTSCSPLSTIYWVTGTIGSSVRMYKENQSHLWTMEPDEIVPAPAGMAMFPQEIAPAAQGMGGAFV